MKKGKISIFYQVCSEQVYRMGDTFKTDTPLGVSVPLACDKNGIIIYHQIRNESWKMEDIQENRKLRNRDGWRFPYLWKLKMKMTPLLPVTSTSHYYSYFCVIHTLVLSFSI